jgi:hypothetical protein
MNRSRNKMDANKIFILHSEQEFTICLLKYNLKYTCFFTFVFRGPFTRFLLCELRVLLFLARNPWRP